MEATLTVSKKHATPAEAVPRQNAATTRAARVRVSGFARRLAARGTGNGIKRPARILDSCWIVAPLWPQVVQRAQGI